MDKSGKFLLPSPKFLKLEKTTAPTPHFLSPQGMLLPKEKQPPPMYGPRGSTVPPKFLERHTAPKPNNQVERTPKFYCDPCEAEFHTSTDFKVHRSEHVQCEIDSCSFRGHPSFMDTHIGLQHATGLYDQLKKLNSPEEIAQWRAERMKNYPTVAIVVQKQKAREQRILRGEKLEAKKNRFGNREDRRQIRTEKRDEAGEKKPSRRHHRKRNRAGKPVAEREIKKKEDVVSAKIEESAEAAVRGGLRMFTGTGGMADYRKVKKVETHALTGLLGMYGSDSDDEEENNEEVETETLDKSESEISLKSINEDPIAHKRSDLSMPGTSTTPVVLEVEPVPEKSTIKVDEDRKPNQKPHDKIIDIRAAPAEDTCEVSAPQDSDDEAPEEAPIAKSSNVPDKPPPTLPPKKGKKFAPKKKVRQSGLDYSKLRVGRQNTLLEKLLEPDIRHERNVLLQCVRFVVQNNFFGIGSPTNQSQP